MKTAILFFVVFLVSCKIKQKKWTKIGTWYKFNEQEKRTDSITFEN